VNTDDEERRREETELMAREHCVNGITVLSFLVGGIIGLGIAILMSPQSGEIREKLKSVVGSRHKLTREEIIEEGIQCAVPEGIDICYPEQEEQA
jgi:hypothetical protein